MFNIGQKVKCIKPGGFKDNNIRNGDILTISTIHSEPSWPSGVLGLDFVAIKSPRPEYSGFNSRWFKPIVEKKTDISIFTKMLNTKKKSEKV